MRLVLADLALEVEGAVAAVMRLCRSFDLAATDPKEARRARILTPAIKYWVCKIAPAFVYEAMECLGGNGYVEDYVLARLYREAPVNAIWEGSGNVMALDLLRIVSNPDDANALVGELLEETSGLPGADGLKIRLRGLMSASDLEANARMLAEQLAMLAAVAALNATAPQIAEIYSRTRLMQGGARLYGAAALAPDSTRLLERAYPDRAGHAL
jgi:putative acyl-CoA dehydrogenase